MDIDVRSICPHAEYDSKINLFRCNQNCPAGEEPCSDRKELTSVWKYYCTRLEITRRLNDPQK